MKVYDAQSIRNVALVGHSGSGKTQLVSTLLFDAGAVNRLGRVDEGTTVTDYDDEEIARKHTLSAALAYAEWNKHKINFIDTPGMANFLSDARAALRVADAALVVVDAVAGVEVSTEKIWEVATELGVPRLVALNRLDRERASLDRSLESLHAVFGRTVVPVQLPIGEEKNFKGVVDLVTMKAWTFADGKASEGAIPGDLQSAADTARESLIEMVAEADDALMEKFFDAGTLTQEELIEGLKRGVAAARIFPLFCVSAAANIGAQPILDAIVTYAPSPLDRPLKARAGTGDDVEIATSESGPAAAFVWKSAHSAGAPAFDRRMRAARQRAAPKQMLDTRPRTRRTRALTSNAGLASVWAADPRRVPVRERGGQTAVVIPCVLRSAADERQGQSAPR